MKSAVVSIDTIRYFKRTSRIFTGRLENKLIEVQKPSFIEDVRKIWENVWSRPKKYNPNAEWIKRGQEGMRVKPLQEWKHITKNNGRQALPKYQ